LCGGLNVNGHELLTVGLSHLHGSNIAVASSCLLPTICRCSSSSATQQTSLWHWLTRWALPSTPAGWLSLLWVRRCMACLGRQANSLFEGCLFACWGFDACTLIAHVAARSAVLPCAGQGCSACTALFSPIVLHLLEGGHRRNVYIDRVGSHEADRPLQRFPMASCLWAATTWSSQAGVAEAGCVHGLSAIRLELCLISGPQR